MSSGSNAFAVGSEYGVLRDVYLCRPDNFQWSDIAKEDTTANAVVRATLRDGVPFDRKTAETGYREFIDAYEGAGVTCHFVETDPALSYQIYTRDPSVMTPWGVFLCQMYRQQRRGEIAPTYRFYEKLGIPVWNWATAGPIEGGDIHLIKPGVAVVGYTGQRTTEVAAKQLQSWLEAEGWECRLQRFAEHFLHLDLLYATVNERLALMCLDVLPDDFVAWVKGHGIQPVAVTYKEAMQLQCNCMSLGDDRVISSKGAKRVNEALRAEGITVLDPDLSMFTQAGGGPRCLSMALKRETV
ncbi:dimethylarginine dimethylaminohydrolase family protein [Nisaea sediminum]|uniref:dimethylarginine dimethylaminohydrolase family protein n=1 Tax=Nisaea sediminum TaxID=2775867 RepID=UPI001866ABE6|nr:arginine deiminase family protein [Nisaea sediminum]